MATSKSFHRFVRNRAQVRSDAVPFSFQLVARKAILAVQRRAAFRVARQMVHRRIIFDEFSASGF